VLCFYLFIYRCVVLCCLSLRADGGSAYLQRRGAGGRLHPRRKEKGNNKEAFPHSPSLSALTVSIAYPRCFLRCCLSAFLYLFYCVSLSLSYLLSLSLSLQIIEKDLQELLMGLARALFGDVRHHTLNYSITPPSN
jgi:hypothetical protein